MGAALVQMAALWPPGGAADRKNAPMPRRVGQGRHGDGQPSDTPLRACPPAAAGARALNGDRRAIARPKELNLNKLHPARWMRGPALAGLLLAAATAAQPADVDVGVSIGISQPGVYGRIDIGRFPQPQVIVQRPVVIVQEAVRPQPIYLHVPPGHRKNWRKHCRAYDACGTPVYFVQERWYQTHVVSGQPPRGDRRHGHRGEKGRGNGHGHGHGRGHD